MRNTINPRPVKYQAQCTCGMRGHKHATETIARLSMVTHLAHAELTGGTSKHHIGVMAILG